MILQCSMLSRRLATTRCSTVSRVRLPQVTPGTNNATTKRLRPPPHKHLAWSTADASPLAFAPADASSEKEKGCPALPRAGHGDTPAPAVIHPLSPVKQKASDGFFFSPTFPPACCRRYAVKRRFSKSPQNKINKAPVSQPR